jgi:UDP-2,3-diacylglucosamine pyrophosphatase LpxH
MKIREDFIQGNDKIVVLSNNGTPTSIPDGWRPILGSCHILAVIPDMHMYIHDSTLDNFKYGADAMLSFLDHLSILKEDLALSDQTLRIYQLGDIYEQRFPSIKDSGSNATATEIRMSNSKYDQILNTMKDIRTHFLYGNHDFELRHFPGFGFGALEGKVYLEHGFVPDKWNDFSNPNAFLWEPSQFVFKTLREIESFFSDLLVDASVIEKDAAIGVTSGKTEQTDYPSGDTYPKQQEEYYTRSLMEHRNGPLADTRVCIIGHTHHPYLNPDVDGGKYIFADAGAWTEGRADFVVVTNEEIAICRYKR